MTKTTFYWPTSFAWTTRGWMPRRLMAQPIGQHHGAQEAVRARLAARVSAAVLVQLACAAGNVEPDLVPGQPYTGPGNPLQR